MDDLISRSAAKEYLGCDENHKYSTRITMELSDLLDEVPTIDAEPVRHGRWAVNENGHAYCTKCGSTLPFIRCYDEETDREWAEEFPETRFCPHCGAKMDGGD